MKTDKSSEFNHNQFLINNIMKKTATLFLVLLSSLVSAQSEMEEIEKTLMNYINGSSYNDVDRIQSAFFEEADLFLSKKAIRLLTLIILIISFYIEV